MSSFDFQIASDRTIFNFGSVAPIEILRSVAQENQGNVPFDIQRKLHSTSTAPEVWDAVASFALIDTVVDENSTLAIRALELRTQRLERLLRDSLGANSVAPFMVDLISRFRGKTFDFEEFKDLVADHGVNLTELAGDLIGSAYLPGFLASNATSQRLEGGEQITYETTFLLENGEPVSGPVRLSLNFRNEVNNYGRPTGFSLNPILVEANQSLSVVIESSNPVHQIWIEPYLSLNRMKLRIDLPEVEQFREQEFVQDDKPYVKSITEVDSLQESLNEPITIDDLDSGFSIEALGRSTNPNNLFRQFVRDLFGEVEVPMDQGLPKYSLFDRARNTDWYRWTDPTAFGIYRRTFTIAARGDGHALAKFSTTLPESGRWQLEYHLPKGHFREEIGFAGSSNSIDSYVTVGPFHLEVRNGSTTTMHTLDAPNLTPGWQTVGTFDLSENEVDVMVSNKTDRLSLSVFADAIRWTPVETEE